MTSVRNLFFIPPRAWLAFHPQNSSPRDGIVLQSVQGYIRFRQRKYLHPRPNRNLRRDPQKLFAVPPGVVSDAANHALLIQQVVGERWDRTHVDPAENQSPALAQSFQCRRYNPSRWGKHNRRVQFLWR